MGFKKKLMSDLVSDLKYSDAVKNKVLNDIQVEFFYIEFIHSLTKKSVRLLATLPLADALDVLVSDQTEICVTETNERGEEIYVWADLSITNKLRLK